MVKILKSKDIFCRFLYTDYYLGLLIIFAFIMFTFNLYGVAIIFFIGLMSLVLIINEDIMPLLMPLLMFSLCMLKCYDMYDEIIVYWFMVIPVIAAFIFRLFLYRQKPHNTLRNPIFLAQIAVSTSIILGGLFSISAKDYFSPIAFSYVLALAPLMLYICYFIDNNVKTSHEVLPHYLAKVMSYTCLMGVCMVLSNVLPKLFTNEAWYFQWKNNLTSNLLLAIPFPFYLSIKSKNGLAYYILGILTGISMILSLSRGGVLFGSIMLAVCALYAAYKRKSATYFAVFAAISSLFAVMVLTLGNLMEIISVDIEPNESRVKLYKLAIKNFFESPIFGKGLGYVGDYYHPKKGALYWYHSTPFQIIASLGIVGICAYFYQFTVRMRVLFAKNCIFNRIIFLSFLGFSLYSLVNVNDFAPFPFVLVLNQLFIIANKLNILGQNDTNNTV